MSVLCLNWETAHLHGETWISQHRLRHRLFVERHGWEVPAYRGMEYDEFDTPAAQYLVWRDETGSARGVTRLIPTTRPYMVKALWPRMVKDELPQAPNVWEATRFGCDRDLPPETRRRVVAEILCAVQEFGIARGIDRLLAVMPVALFRCVIARAGCPVSRLGPAIELAGHPTGAAYIDVGPEVLAEVRRRNGVTHPVLEHERALAA